MAKTSCAVVHIESDPSVSFIFIPAYALTPEFFFSRLFMGLHDMTSEQSRQSTSSIMSTQSFELLVLLGLARIESCQRLVPSGFARTRSFQLLVPCGLARTPIISASGILGTREDSVISASGTLRTREDSICFSFWYPGDS